MGGPARIRTPAQGMHPCFAHIETVLHIPEVERMFRLLNLRGESLEPQNSLLRQATGIPGLSCARVPHEGAGTWEFTLDCG